MTFQAAALTVFAAASITALNGGALQLLDSGGGVLATYPLDTPCSTAVGAVQTFYNFPKSATAVAGTVASARFRTSAAVDWKTGVSVGIPGSGAQVVVNNGSGTLALTTGQTVTVSAGPTITLAGA